MKFSFHAQAMSRALAFCNQIVERRNTIPILGNVMIQVDGKTISITGTDLDIQGLMTIEAIEPAAKPFAFTIGAKMFHRFVKEAEGEITADINHTIATFAADGFEMEVNLPCPPEDFPTLKFDAEGQAEIPEALFLKTLQSTAICISQEETRYYLNGIFLHPHDRQLVAVATDGHRLAMYRPKHPWTIAGAILPRKTASLLMAVMKPGSNAGIKVHQSGTKMQFIHPDWTITSKMIDGKFPDYTRVIPQPTGEIETVLSYAQLRRFPPQYHFARAVKIEPSKGIMSMHEQGEAIKITMKITGKGGPICFNAKYLQAFSKQFGTIKLTGSHAGDLAMVTVEDPAFSGVIMPMRF